MSGLNRSFPFSSSSSFSTSSSSQLSTPRTLENGCLQNLLCVTPRVSSSQSPGEKKYSEKANAEKHTPSREIQILTPKSSAELKKEIATIDFEILRLERYLLTLYRAALDERVPSMSSVSRSNSQQRLSLQKQSSVFVRLGNVSDMPKLPSCLEPSSAMEIRRTESGHGRLADLLGVSHMLENLETPHRLSQQILTHISSVYRKLSAFDSSNSASETTVEKSGSKLAVVDILKLCLDKDNFKCVEEMLRNYRSLVQNLEKVDPINMTREEKLAFWINVHNALLMHASLAYGTHDRAKSAPVLKAAYNIGGQCVTAYDIQTSILSIRPHNRSPRRQTLFSPNRKPNIGCGKHVYAVEYPEPLVHFGLCSGASADPMVRVYTKQRIFKDLRRARNEFLRRNVIIQNERKILLPRILYCYAKDASLDIAGLMDAVTSSMSETQRQAMKKCLTSRQGKCVHWLPQISGFRYVIHGDLVGGRSDCNA